MSENVKLGTCVFPTHAVPHGLTWACISWRPLPSHEESGPAPTPEAGEVTLPEEIRNAIHVYGAAMLRYGMSESDDEDSPESLAVDNSHRELCTAISRALTSRRETGADDPDRRVKKGFRIGIEAAAKSVESLDDRDAPMDAYSIGGVADQIRALSSTPAHEEPDLAQAAAEGYEAGVRDALLGDAPRELIAALDIPTSAPAPDAIRERLGTCRYVIGSLHRGHVATPHVQTEHCIDWRETPWAPDAHRPQTPRDPTGESPPLETDPRAQRCDKHGLLLYPGELCQECLAEKAAPDEHKETGGATHWCEKCGYIGSSLVHDGCNYYALPLAPAPSPSDESPDDTHSRRCKRNLCDQGMWCPEQHRRHAASDESPTKKEE